jgi:hypothetical protein
LFSIDEPNPKKPDDYRPEKAYKYESPISHHPIQRISDGTHFHDSCSIFDSRLGEAWRRATHATFA